MPDSLQEYLAYAASLAAFFIPLAAVLVAGVIGMGIGMWRPHLLVAAYLLPFFFFASGTYGALEQTRTIWARGSGQLYLPFVWWLLLGIFAVTWLSDRYSGRQTRATPLHPWFFAFGILLGAHLLAALALDESIFWAAHANGFREFVAAGLVFALLLRAFRDGKSIQQLVFIFMACVLIRGIFGLVRFAFFGGDPANAYLNFENIKVRLTFFDINDSLLATVAIFMAAWALIGRWRDTSFVKRVFLMGYIALELAVVLLSYRRTAWGGVVLALALFVAILPVRKAILAAAVGAPPALIGIAYASSQRLGKQGDLLTGFLGDVSGGSVLAITQRAYELRLAWQTFLDHPVFGVGSWGVYHRGLAQITWQVGEHPFAFLHSGLLHIMVKAGIVGLALFIGLCWSFVHFVLKHRHEVALEWRGLYFAGMAGFLFMIPTWILGTPVVEMRTMQLFALCMALPFFALRASRQAAAAA